MIYDRLYVEFLYYFNVTRDYFECHEVLEELWLEEGRNPLLQGLLQAAVGLYHCRNDNYGGAIKLFNGSIDKLEGYPADSLGIDLGKLLLQMKQYVRELEHRGEQPFAFYDLTIDIIDHSLEQAVKALIDHPPRKEE